MPEDPPLELPPLSDAGLVMTGVSTISLVDDLVSPFSVTTTTVVRVEGGSVVTDSSGVDESLSVELDESVGVGAGVVSVRVSDVTGGSSEVDGVVEGGVELGVVEGGAVVDGVVSRDDGVVEGPVVLGVVLRVKVVVPSSSPRVTWRAKMCTTSPNQVACAMATKRTEKVRMVTSGRAHMTTWEQGAALPPGVKR